MSCGVGHRRSSDPGLLWYRLVAIAPIQLLAWEPPYTMGVALKSKKTKKRKAVGDIYQGVQKHLLTLTSTPNKINFISDKIFSD